MTRTGSSQHRHRAALMTGVGLALLWATPALAQQRHQYNIHEGAAAQRVQMLATESGVQVIAPNADLAGIRTHAVRGDYTPLEALRQMLAGTGLEVTSSGGTLVITRASAGAPPAAQASAGGAV